MPGDQQRNVLPASAVEVREPIDGITDADSDEFTTVQEALAQLAAGANLATLIPPVLEAAGVTTSQDLEVTDDTAGLILVSPDDTRWRVTVGDDGALDVTEVV